jgi:hypothetical protein
MCALTVILLCFPGTPLDFLWHLNPAAQSALSPLEGIAILLMCLVGAGCAITAIGLWRGATWGVLLAIVILSLNLIGDLLNATVRGDYRALIGLPIGGAMIAYLAWNVGTAFAPRRSRRKGRSHILTWFRSQD